MAGVTEIHAEHLDWPRELVHPTAPLDARRQRIDLAGVLIDRIDLNVATDRLDDFLESGIPHQVLTVNLDFLNIAQKHSEFRAVINSADLAVADGMPLLWLARLQRSPLAQRITGVELVDASCRLAAETDQGVFLLGAAPGVPEAAGRRLQSRYPRLRVAGAYSPPFGPLSQRENERIVDMVRAAAPGVLLVAFGAPRQDLWIHTHRDELRVPVAMGVGCVFDLLAGIVRRAPEWMQRTGLEWSFRLAQEPSRLWRRYLLDDLPLLGRLALAATSRRASSDVTIVHRPGAPSLTPSRRWPELGSTAGEKS